MSIKIRQAVTADSITYEQYARVIDIIASGKSFEEAGMFGDFFKKVFSPLKKVFESVKESVGLGIEEFARAFKAKNVYALMKAIKFNIALLFKGVIEAGKLVDRGLLKVVQQVTRSETFQKVKQGVIKFDALLDEHPILKKVAGVALAGLLFWIWLNMSFTGNASSDFDLSMVGAALFGKYSLEDLFTSDEGVYMIALLLPGIMGISFPWLGHKVANLILAIAYTGYKYLRDSGKLSELKALIPIKKQK